MDQLTRLAEPDTIDRQALAHLRRVPDGPDGLALDSTVPAAGLFAWVNGTCRQTANVNFGRAFGLGLSEDDKK